MRSQILPIWGEDILLVRMPKALQQGKIVAAVETPNNNIATTKLTQITPLTLNSAQQDAVQQITRNKGFQTFLLDGVTGSGKTEVYLQTIAHVLQQQQQALVLVPEIGLTPQTVARFARRFSVPIYTWHSNLTEKKRLTTWLAAKQQAAIIIGTRSAIFMPCEHLGIIIIDEEHDYSFKQQSGFRYSARDLAVVRAQIEKIPIVLGSATPSLESLQNVRNKNYIYLSLPKRATEAQMPDMQLIDLRLDKPKQGLSQQLIRAIEQHLNQDQQVLLFLNRRGFAPTLLCTHCSWMAQCKSCDARLVLHQSPAKLVCHHCAAIYPVPNACKQCQHQPLLPVGQGTERLEQTLIEKFPQAEIFRIDRDSTRKNGALEKLLSQVQYGKKQILLGTQMLAKGHHLANLSMVGIIDADGHLFSADFRAQERMAQLLVQVAGRAGREKTTGTVYIQTHFPHHPLFKNILSKGYNFVADELLKERKQTQLPPFTYLALLRAEAKQLSSSQQFLQTIADQVKNDLTATIQLHGPIPALMEKKRGVYRTHLAIQSQHRPALREFLPRLLQIIEQHPQQKKIRWSVEVDPLEVD